MHNMLTLYHFLICINPKWPRKCLSKYINFTSLTISLHLDTILIWFMIQTTTLQHITEYCYSSRNRLIILHTLGWTFGFDVIKMATAVKFTQKHILTHVRSIHTNVKVSSKHIRTTFGSKNICFTIRPMRTSNFKLFVLL
jgi:hypothetical protein